MPGTERRVRSLMSSARAAPSAGGNTDSVPSRQARALATRATSTAESTAAPPIGASMSDSLGCAPCAYSSEPRPRSASASASPRACSRQAGDPAGERLRRVQKSSASWKIVSAGASLRPTARLIPRMTAHVVCRAASPNSDSARRASSAAWRAPVQVSLSASSRRPSRDCMLLRIELRGGRSPSRRGPALRGRGAPDHTTATFSEFLSAGADIYCLNRRSARAQPSCGPKSPGAGRTFPRPATPFRSPAWSRRESASSRTCSPRARSSRRRGVVATPARPATAARFERPRSARSLDHRSRTLTASCSR